MYRLNSSVEKIQFECKNTLKLFKCFFKFKCLLDILGITFVYDSSSPFVFALFVMPIKVTPCRSPDRFARRSKNSVALS